MHFVGYFRNCITTHGFMNVMEEIIVLIKYSFVLESYLVPILQVQTKGRFLFICTSKEGKRNIKSIICQMHHLLEGILATAICLSGNRKMSIQRSSENW
jgi:hypothetical protein